jgi:hypothetical protein
MLQLNRRTFLRGIGGVAVGLPLLDAMLNDSGTAHADSGPLSKRYLVSFGGFSLGTDGANGGVKGPAQFIPTLIGKNYDLRGATQSLANHGNIKDHISIVSGLKIPFQSAKNPSLPIPPGGATVVFHFHANPLLTGKRSLPWTTSDITNGRVTGASSDQIVADALGAPVFPSLVYRGQALFYNSAIAPDGHDNLSYRDDGNGGAIPVVPTTRPQQAYQALFNLFPSDDPAERARQALELAKRKSVLDLVDRRMSGLLPKLGAADKARLDRHYEEIRALEALLGKTVSLSGGACAPVADPGADPPLGGESGSGYDVNKGYSGEDVRLRTFCDLIHMAMTCDLTRAGSLMFTMMQSYMNVNPFLNIQRNAHGIAHGGTPAELDKLIDWHLGHFGYLVSKFRDTPEGSGTLLDSSALVFLIEGGYGLGYENATPTMSSHSTENMACLIAGGAGGLRQGEHIDLSSSATNHPANVLVSAMNAVGVNTNTLGEVNGACSALFV